MGNLASKRKKQIRKKAKQDQEVDKVKLKILTPAEQMAKEKLREIDEEVNQRKRRNIILLVGSPGAGKRTIIRTYMKKYDHSHQFTYNLHSFEINEYSPSKEMSSEKFKHLNTVMSVIRQKNILSEYLYEEDDINYDDESKNALPPLLISAYYNSERSDINSNNPFPDDLCEVVNAFIGSIGCINSYCYKMDSCEKYELWNSDHSSVYSLSPLFVYCSAIVFVLDITGYNEYIIDEKSGKNVSKMSYDLDIFEEFIEQVRIENNHTQIFVFFNKVDLFKDRIKHVGLHECDLFADFKKDYESYCRSLDFQSQCNMPDWCMNLEFQFLYQSAMRRIKHEICNKLSDKKLKYDVHCFATDAHDADNVRSTFWDAESLIHDKNHLWQSCVSECIF